MELFTVSGTNLDDTCATASHKAWQKNVMAMAMAMARSFASMGYV